MVTFQKSFFGQSVFHCCVAVCTLMAHGRSFLRWWYCIREAYDPLRREGELKEYCVRMPTGCDKKRRIKEERLMRKIKYGEK